MPKWTTRQINELPALWGEQQVVLPKGPDARRRVGHAAATWLGLTLAAIAAFSAVVIWHLVRRGRLIRDRLGPPRPVELPALNPEGTSPASPSGGSP